MHESVTEVEGLIIYFSISADRHSLPCHTEETTNFMLRTKCPVHISTSKGPQALSCSTFKMASDIRQTEKG